MANRNELGQFLGKSSQPRQVRSVRATDAVWERVNTYADSVGKSVADVFEQWVLTLPVNQPSPDPFSGRLRSLWHEIASSQVGEAVYGHPVPLKSLFSWFEMTWDDFLAAVAAVDAVDASIELIATRGHNYQVGNRRVSSLTYHG